MPTDPQTLQFDETELSSTLSEIETIINSAKFNDILLGGDINYHET